MSLVAVGAYGQQVGWGTITTIAGTGRQGYGGDGGPATQATFNFNIGSPLEEEFGHIALDGQGNLYICDRGNHRVRKVDTNGTITTIAGTGTAGSSGDGGPATRAALNLPAGVAVDRSGVVYIADQGNHRIRRVDASGNISTVAGTGSAGSGGDGGPAGAATLDAPGAVAVDATGNLYIADTFNDRVRVVAAGTNVISTLAGTGEHSDADVGRDDVAANTVKLGWPSGLALDAAGNLFIADQHNNVVRVVNLTGRSIRRVAGNAQHSDEDPRGDDGPATAAPLGFPIGVTVDAAGDLYIADMHNNAIRRVAAPLSPGAVITTPVGTGEHSFGGDGGPGWAAALDYPSSVAIDSSRNLILADWHNQRIRRAAPGTTPSGPAITRNGVVNGASFLPVPPNRVAPGSIVSIFGRRLAPGAASATQLPLPRTLLDPAVSVTATVGSNTFLMPLFFVSPTQINAQLPIELPAFSTATIIARVGDRQSEPLRLELSHSETGIFLYGQNRALALNQDGRLNTIGEGAARGSVITVFLTGQGELSPSIPTGQPAPTAPLSRSTLEIHATIGGASARVDFLGAAPGWVALGQANIVVPDNAPVGDQPLQINVGGHDSNRATITIR
jgi:uncharacterized protein (TIGR03437 family)